MKILLIGDTHGKLNKVYSVLQKIKNVDLIAHTGDFLRDATELSRRTGIPVVGTKGNCDGSYSKDDFATFESEYGKIMVTHGHTEHVDYKLDTLQYKLLEAGCRAVFYGHTHIPLVEEYQGIYFINPGSLTRPRDGSNGSFAVVNTFEDRIDASIIYYKD